MSTESTIKDLVQTLEDGRKGFADAAAKLADDGNTQLATEFTQFAEQRQRFSSELRTVAASAGVEFDEDGSVAGALHRGWIALKDALTGDDPDAIVNAAETGEEHAVSEYEKALDRGELPSDVAMLVKRQAEEIRTVRDRLAALTA